MTQSIVEKINEEVSIQLANQATIKSLIETTFKGFTPELMKKAIVEAMIRGFDFKSILEKDVYPIPYGGGYSLIPSISYVRKVAMRSGLSGKGAPVFTFKADGKPETCTITVKRHVNGQQGEYTATVYFDEYNTNKNQWLTKPKTMLAKVAEMHAIRSGFPEETSQFYTEEELAKPIEAIPSIDISVYEDRLKGVKSIDELKEAWASLPIEAKKELEVLKEEMKQKYANN